MPAKQSKPSQPIGGERTTPRDILFAKIAAAIDVIEVCSKLPRNPTDALSQAIERLGMEAIDYLGCLFKAKGK